MQKASVIIPAYNAARYVREAVDSALAQTYPDCEVIVVDDGSTDDTPQILAQYGSRIRLIRQANGGSADACNTGVAAATGAWIAFLDADDIWLPQKLERQLAAAGDCAISHTDSVCFGESIAGEILRSSFEPPFSGEVLDRLLVRNFITKSSVALRRQVFHECGGFSARYPGVEDWPFWLKVCARHPLAYVPEPLVRYRVHRKSKSMDSRKMITDHRRIIDDAFGPGGVGESRAALRAEALAASYEINLHYAAETGDWPFAIRCALGALRYRPQAPQAWKGLVKSALIPLGVRY